MLYLYISVNNAVEISMLYFFLIIWKYQEHISQDIPITKLQLNQPNVRSSLHHESKMVSAIIGILLALPIN